MILPAPPAGGRPALLRRLGYIMLLRVVLLTLIVGGTVAVYLVRRTPEELAGPYVMVLFVFITAMYLVNIVYALSVRRTENLRLMAGLQVGIDLVASAVLVHFTGSAESAFVVFLMLGPIEAALTMGRRAAIYVAMLASTALVAVVLLGYFRVLPVLSGQISKPWEIAPSTVTWRLLLSCGAMAVVAALADYLAEQLRSATTHVEAQRTQLEDMAALYGDVVRCLTSGLLTIDTEGRILSLNEVGSQLLGVQAMAVEGCLLTTVVPELAALTKTALDLHRTEVTTRVGGRSVVLGVSVSLLVNSHNESVGYIFNFQDLTRLRQMEQTIRRSEHLASLGRVAAGVAHEIRNPLASISGSLELLRGDTGVAGENRVLMEIALREIERLNALINDLLDYARPTEEPRLETVDLGTEIGPIALHIGSLVFGNDAPRVVVAESAPGLWVAADLNRLSGVLLNLVQNAWQAGEHEVVELAVQPKDRNHVRLCVSDHGRGMTTEQLSHIFEPFYTTRPNGAGLGLAIVHRTVQDHRASIEVDSKPGHGTTFTIDLPRVAPPSSTPDA